MADIFRAVILRVIANGQSSMDFSNRTGFNRLFHAPPKLLLKMILTWSKNANQVLSMRIVVYKMSQHKVRFALADSTFEFDFVAYRNNELVSKLISRA